MPPTNARATEQLPNIFTDMYEGSHATRPSHSRRTKQVSQPEKARNRRHAPTSTRARQEGTRHSTRNPRGVPQSMGKPQAGFEPSSGGLPEHLRCGYCNEEFVDPRFLPCLHTYCLKCVTEMIGIEGHVNCAGSRCTCAEGCTCALVDTATLR